MADEIHGGLGSLVDSFLKISFNWKGLSADPEFRNCLRTLSSLAAKYIDSPMQIDNPLIDNLEKQIEALLDQIKAHSPGNHDLIVGAMAPNPQEAAAASARLSQIGDACKISFSEDVRAKVRQYPKVLSVIDHKSLDQQGKILASPEWLQKVIDWLVKYGPTIAQILAVILIPLL